jgi:DNA-binding transcriptional LysR family regulator
MTVGRWSALEVRHLVAFRAIVEHGSFGAAAANLGYTQSAISQQIAALERIVGHTVLLRPRGRKPLGLTPEGELLLGYARTILRHLDAAEANLGGVTAANERLRVGTYQSIGMRILSEFLPGFRVEWPGTEVHLRESTSDEELLLLVRRGELDLAFCMLPSRDGPFDAVELLRDPYYLVVPSGSHLAQRGFKLADAAGLSLVGYRTCPQDPDVETLLRARGIEVTVMSRSDDNATIQMLVGAQVGAAIMPELSIDRSDPKISVVEIDGLLPPRLLGATWNRDREQSAPAQAFVAAALSVCASRRSS